MDLLSPPDQPTKKISKDALKNKSFRFELSLKTTGEVECPEFSYLELVRSKLKKRKVKNSSAELNDELKAKHEAESMAQYFEQKYGASSDVSAKRRRQDRMRDLADVGYGYDESDPFVDNSECYDELIPSSLTTQFGGFYINSGRLEFKQVSDDSNAAEDEDSLPLSAHMSRRKNKFFSSDEDTDDSLRRKKIKKRKISVEREEKRRKLSLQGKDKLKKLSKSTKKKPTKVQLLVAKARKAQHHINSAAEKANIGKPTSSKQPLVNGSMHKDSSMTQSSERSFVSSLKEGDGDHSSSSDDVSLAKLSVSTKEGNKLPESLPQNIKDQISSLTKIAKSNEKEGKVKFFSPDVNHLLLGIEAGSQSLSNRERSGIYQHLTPHMPCSKDTLIRRMKRLHASKQDEKLRTPLSDLKRAIDAVMGEQTKRYDEECAAQQLAKLDAPLAASTDEDDDGTSTTPSAEEKTKRTYAPRRKFHWSNDIRSLLSDVIKVKVQQYGENKSKLGVAADEYLKNFLETEVKCLWPKGWMQSRALYKETRDIHGNVTGNAPKVKKAPPTTTRKPGSVKSEKKPISFSGLSRPYMTDSSLSMQLSLSSEAEELSPSKRAEMMNQAILSAQKDLTQPKPPRKAQKYDGGSDRSCYVKLSSSLKEAALNQPRSPITVKFNETIHKTAKNDAAKLTMGFLEDTAKLKMRFQDDSIKLKAGSLSDSVKLKAGPLSDSVKLKVGPQSDFVKLKAGSLSDSVKLKAGSLSDSIKLKAGPLSDSVKLKAGSLSDSVKLKAGSLSDSMKLKVGSLSDSVKLKAVSLSDSVKLKAGSLSDSVKLKAGPLSDSVKLKAGPLSDSVKLNVGSLGDSEKLKVGSRVDSTKRIFDPKQDSSKRHPTQLADVVKHHSTPNQEHVRNFSTPKHEQVKVASTLKQAIPGKTSLSRKSYSSAGESAKPPTSSSRPTPSLPTSLDTFSAELLKLALMSPPGGPSLLSGLGLSTERMPQSSLDDLASFMKLQQAALQEQLHPGDIFHSVAPTFSTNQIKSKQMHSTKTDKISSKDETKKPPPQKDPQKRAPHTGEPSKRVPHQNDSLMMTSHHNDPSMRSTSQNEHSKRSSHHRDPLKYLTHRSDPSKHHLHENDSHNCPLLLNETEKLVLHQGELRKRTPPQSESLNKISLSSELQAPTRASQHSESQKRVSLHREPQKLELVHSEPQKRAPLHSEPQKRAPVHSEPQKRAPVHSEPQKRAPVHREPQKRVSVHSEPQKRAPVHSEPQERAPVHREPQKRAPVHSEPQKRAPVHSEPQKRAPVHSEPQKRAPVHREPQKRAPVHSEPQNRAPVHSEPQKRAPVHSEPQKRAPVYSEPQNRAPVHSEPQERAPVHSDSQKRPFCPNDPPKTFLHYTGVNTVSTSQQLKHHSSSPIMPANNHSSPNLTPSLPASPHATSLNRNTSSNSSFHPVNLSSLDGASPRSFPSFSGSYPPTYVSSEASIKYTLPPGLYAPQEQRKSPYKPPSDSNRFAPASLPSASELDEAAMKALLSVHQQYQTGNRR